MNWQHCASSGNDYAIDGNVRFVRVGPAPYLYRAEFWGDYSLRFPVNGAWRKSLPKARHDAARLRGKVQS